MKTLSEARQLLANAVSPLPAVQLRLTEALGLVLANAPVTDVDAPPADVSAMDGYAVAAADLSPDPMPVAFEVPAGASPGPLPRGAAARIFTGAALPEGADTVVQQELAEVLPDGCVRLQARPAGTNVRRRGELFAAGQELAAAGDLVTPQRLALLAAGGAAVVTATPRPGLAVLSTGSELAPVDEAPGAGKIRDSNGPLLDALARRAGMAAPRVSRAPDVRGDLRRGLADLLADADAVLTTGGVSVGAYDLVPEAVQALGGEILVHGVAMRPGKPVLVARIDGRWLIGLPGNPLAVLVGWRMLALPLLRALAGDPAPFDELPEQLPLASATASPGRRMTLRPARLIFGVAGWTVEVLPWKGSHDLVAAAAADALVSLNPGDDLPAGTPVPLFRL